jgi:quinol monooxygenase YgiN
MATILAHIKIFDGKEQEFEKTVKGLWEATHRLEPHCRRYEYWRAEKPGHYYCLLSFDDFRSFMVHQTSDHHEAPDFPALLETIRLEWLDPIQGASDLAPTEPQDVPDDADELTKRYAQDHAVVMQDWWNKLR